MLPPPEEGQSNRKLRIATRAAGCIRCAATTRSSALARARVRSAWSRARFSRRLVVGVGGDGLGEGLHGVVEVAPVGLQDGDIVEQQRLEVGLGDSGAEDVVEVLGLVELLALDQFPGATVQLAQPIDLRWLRSRLGPGGLCLGRLVFLAPRHEQPTITPGESFGDAERS